MGIHWICLISAGRKFNPVRMGNVNLVVQEQEVSVPCFKRLERM